VNAEQERRIVTTWIEDALICGWAHGWSDSPLLWAPLSRRRWGRRLAITTLALVAVAGIGSAMAVVSGLTLLSRPLAAAGFQVVRLPLMILAAILAICLVLSAWALPVMLLGFGASRFRGTKGRRGDRTYGTARFHPLREEWWNPDEAVAAALVLRPERPGAEDGLVPWVLEDTAFVHFTWGQLSRHMLVVGATGSGKTTSFYHHLMLSSRVPWIYQDQKAELPLYDRFPERPVWGLDTRGYASRSGVWNPMEEVRAPEDIEVMSALLFPDKGNMNDWIAHGARMLFEAMCKRWRFSSLQEYVYLIEHTSLDRIIADLPHGYTTALADARSRAYIVSEILDVLRPWINTSRIAQVTFGKSTVTLDDFMARGGYVLCNEDKHLRQPVTLFWGMLLHRLRNRPSSDASPLLLLLDEFGDAGRIPNMAEALAMYRSKGVGIVAGVQSFALMESVYGEREWRAVRDGFGTTIVFAANITAQLQMELSDQLGSFTMEHRQGNAGLGGPTPSVHAGLSSPSRVASPLVPLDQWAQWSAARAAIVRGAKGPTWWIPWPVDITATPAGDRLTAAAAEDWRFREAERVAALGVAVRGLPVANAGPATPDAGEPPPVREMEVV
jgi:type IV secretory pathway TraG/TraD family ATPase VirD4